MTKVTSAVHQGGRARSVVGLIGRRLAGGRKSVEVFGKLLRLEDGAKGGRVAAVGWIYDRVEVQVCETTGTEYVLVFERAKWDGLGSMRTPWLALGIRSHGVSETAMRVLAGFSRKWRHLTLEKLAGVLMRDPDLGKPGLPLPTHPDEFRGSRSQLDTWGGQDAYGDFFARGETERAQLDSVDFFDRSISIQHSDLECSNVVMGGRAPSMSLVNLPWDGRWVAANPAGGSVGGGGYDHGRRRGTMLTTDLTDDDVISGSGRKLGAVLDHVLAHHQDRMLFFSNTCVPVVTGEDVESVVRRHAAKSSAPLVYLTVTPESMNSVFKSLLLDRRLEAEAEGPPGDPQAVNLIGFQAGPGLGELCAILRDIGVWVNTLLLPPMDPTRIESLPKARTNVFSPNHLWRHLYEQLLVASRLRAVFQDPPFGVDGTRKWLHAIASAAGRAEREQTGIARAWAASEAEWATLSREAHAFRLVFVVRCDELHNLLEPANTWGVALWNVVHEMGFAAEVGILVSEVRQEREGRMVVERLLGAHPEDTWFTFSSHDMLMDRLRRSEGSAVFTQHFFDWRVTSSGKNIFSLSDFEMGFAGAVRSLRRLLERCRTSFFRKYAGHLQRTPSGLRLSGGEEAV